MITREPCLAVRDLVCELLGAADDEQLVGGAVRVGVRVRVRVASPPPPGKKGWGWVWGWG